MTCVTFFSSYVPVGPFLQRWALALVLTGCVGYANAAPTIADEVNTEHAMQRLAESASADVASNGRDADTGVPDRAEAGGFVESLRDRASDMVTTAMDFLGVPYRRGGSSESAGFDCSGFTRHIFERSLGLMLPRRADEQAKAPGFMTVARDQLRPGDLVFFNTLRRTFSHVGIYVGEGKFIHAPRPGGAVRVEDMSVLYWSRRFTGARRIDGDATPMLRSMRLEH